MANVFPTGGASTCLLAREFPTGGEGSCHQANEVPTRYVVISQCQGPMPHGARLTFLAQIALARGATRIFVAKGRCPSFF